MAEGRKLIFLESGTDNNQYRFHKVLEKICEGDVFEPEVECSDTHRKALNIRMLRYPPRGIS